MPRNPTRRALRLFRRRSIRFMRGQVPLREIPRGLARLLDLTLRLAPVNPNILVNHNARSKLLDRQLAWSLAFVAGAVNAGGFLAVRTYTSHMSGNVSKIADEWALGHHILALQALSIIGFFTLGAFCSSLLISLGRRHRFKSHYAFSLMIEAVLLMIFGLLGKHLHHIHHFFLPLTVILLAFIMGLQNAMVTTISNAEVRTTHMTGIITDLGIELSRLFYFNWNQNRRVKQIRANRDKLKLHGLILVSFFGGGFLGAVAFRRVGFHMTLFLAAFLFLLAVRPLIYDLRVRWRLLQLPMI